jgi:hypothetical protein
METKFFVVEAPGHYGDTTRVLSSHRTLQAARKAAGSSGRYTVRSGALKKGDAFLRVYEQTYQQAER